MGGIGKTVLAAALAREDDVRLAFPDGVLWIAVGQQPNLVALQAELSSMVGHPKLAFTSILQGKRELEQFSAGTAVHRYRQPGWQLDNEVEALIRPAWCLDQRRAKGGAYRASRPR